MTSGFSLQTRPYKLRKGFVRLSPEVTTAPSYTKRRKEKRALESLVGALSRHEKSRVSNWHSEALPAVP